MKTLPCLLLPLLLAVSWNPSALAAESSPPVAALPAGFDGKQPQLAADARDKALYLVVGKADGEIFCARSADGGSTFSPPVKVGALPKLALGMRRGPRIAADNGQVTITAVSHETGLIVAFRSADKGQTWSAPVTINPGTNKSAQEGLHGMAVRARDGLLYAVWLDSREAGKSIIYGSSSADHGATWSANRPVYRSPEGSVCPCCHPSATFDAGGTLTVMWRNALGGSRDLYTAISNDGGQSFGSAVKQGQGTWKLNACPMDGGSVAALPGTNSTATVWQRAGSVYLERKTGTTQMNELLLAPGVQPVAVATADGAVVTIWQEKGGALFAAKTPANASAAVAPQRLAGPGGGYATLVNSPIDATPVAAWEGNDRQVYVAQIR